MILQEKISLPSKNSLQPSGAQPLRLWKRLGALHRGTLAVPAEDGQPALPLRTKPLSLARILRDSRLEGLGNFHNSIRSGSKISLSTRA